jgi:carbonic anhydrase/acetyltransferase-like protein (isoleucine patch superfamily)
VTSLHLPEPWIAPDAFVASTAVIMGDVRVAQGAVIMFGVVARAELARISVGAGSNVQDNCVLHSEEGLPCSIGERTTVGHAAVVHGATVGDGCLVGIASQVLNSAVMGEGSWLAAGSLLAEGKEIPAWTLAMGVPAKPVRDLTENEIARQRNGVVDYQRIAAAYRASQGL